MKKRVVSHMLLLLLLTPLAAGAEDIIREGELLTLERCIEIGLGQHPAVAAARSEVDANRSRVGQAQSGYYPQIDGSASTSRTSIGPRQSLGFRTGSAIFNSYSTGVTLTQNIYDFGRTGSQVDIQKYNLDSSRSDLETTYEQVVLNVKQAYYGVLQAQRNREVALETVRQFEQHLEQARGFFEVGTAPKFDVTKAEVDLSNAKLNLIVTKNALKVAVVRLNNTMGVPRAPEYRIEDNLSFERYEIPFEEAVERAYRNRPDLQSLIFQRKAAESSIALVRKDYYPVLTGNAGYNYAGNEFPITKGWTIGATLTLPIFSGFLTKNQVEEAQANLKTLLANEESLKQNILLEVQQEYLNLAEAEERISTAELTVKQAEENLEIATGRYRAGVGSPIEVTDAEVLLSDAKTAHIQALYDYKIARANLEKAMGIR
jgi:TolC family type I secretion outer membrane protein